MHFAWEAWPSMLLHMCVAWGGGQSFLQHKQRNICIVVASAIEAVFSPLEVISDGRQNQPGGYHMFWTTFPRSFKIGYILYWELHPKLQKGIWMAIVCYRKLPLPSSCSCKNFALSFFLLFKRQYLGEFCPFFFFFYKQSTSSHSCSIYSLLPWLPTSPWFDYMAWRLELNQLESLSFLALQGQHQMECECHWISFLLCST